MKEMVMQMKNKLIEDIRRYIDYLYGLGLYITVHGEGGRSLEEYNIHKNPFCSLDTTIVTWYNEDGVQLSLTPF